MPSMLKISDAVKIRRFSRNDVQAILEIQKLYMSASAWGWRDYEQLAGDPRGMILVAEHESGTSPELVGFAVAYRVDEEAELWNIAVAPRYRRQGIARSLLKQIRQTLAIAGVQRLFLEVRSSNTPAMELYQGLGFTPLLTRKGYYQDPSEDALLLVCRLIPSGA